MQQYKVFKRVKKGGGGGVMSKSSHKMLMHTGSRINLSIQQVAVSIIYGRTWIKYYTAVARGA